MFSPPRSNEGGEDGCAGFRLSHLGPRSFDRVEIDAESYRNLPRVLAEISCPACGHTYTKSRLG